MNIAINNELEPNTNTHKNIFENSNKNLHVENIRT